MTEFKKILCPKCKNLQLENTSKPNSLIVRTVCRNCWYEQLTCNVLGTK